MKSGPGASPRSSTQKPVARHPRKPRASPNSDLGPPRNFVGYGRNPPHPRWPGDARIALNFNLNVEAGGERSILEGDARSENILTDIGYPSYEGRAAHWSSRRSNTARASAVGGCCAFSRSLM